MNPAGSVRPAGVGNRESKALTCQEIGLGRANDDRAVSFGGSDGHAANGVEVVMTLTCASDRSEDDNRRGHSGEALPGGMSGAGQTQALSKPQFRPIEAPASRSLNRRLV